MIEIKDLLSRFSNILLKEEVKIQSIKKVIEEVVGVQVPKENIKIKGDTVHLDLKPIYKGEILIKREEISKKLEELLGAKTPKNFR
jgi:hypothetical protein